MRADLPGSIAAVHPGRGTTRPGEIGQTWQPRRQPDLGPPQSHLTSGLFPCRFSFVSKMLCDEMQERMSAFDQLKFDANGLIPAIIQEQKSGRVLMMAWMNRASLEKTLETRKTHFWSRSRQKFWMKGETSGHTQTVKDVAFDCDGDTLLSQVDQIGAACHEGYRSCFFRSTDSQGTGFRITEPRLESPEAIYGKK